MSRHVVSSVDDFPPGTRRLITVKGRPIVVFNIEGEYFALLNRCPHQQASLFHGTLTGLVASSEPGCYKFEREGEILRCPWHGWEFDIRTGQSYCDPSKIQAKSYKIEIEDGASVVKGPYIAETFSIVVEENYVVLEL
ncbi:Rieske (2Fe-2S) protein [Bosea sp. BK604]|uniref:Rieske (2Fe-2S) protein n=1 Tax=Bosea sp. BK604 TaxID=2512180 RepID=UPI00104DE068|nr:Rieske (2Fe-2S) protein [Bosea sp. BK604]TCR63168.1 3-phenylpropionate/trans-cinnamate dioxygenase ferredoxin subunit [Bosea sp. BK604]